MEPHSYNGLQFIEWGVASRALPGERTSGDLYLVRPRSDGALVAVIDGLGHGSEAAEAARKAVESLEAHPDGSIISLVQRSHEELRATRGAAMTVVLFNCRENTVTTLGIGNVETILLRADRAAIPPYESVVLRGGVVGYQLPAIRASVFPIYPGDLMIFATDGIRSGFEEKINFSDSPQQLVNGTLERNFRGVDDALVLAVRYVGNSQ